MNVINARSLADDAILRCRHLSKGLCRDCARLLAARAVQVCLDAATRYSSPDRHPAAIASSQGIADMIASYLE